MRIAVIVVAVSSTIIFTLPAIAPTGCVDRVDCGGIAYDTKQTVPSFGISRFCEQKWTTPTNSKCFSVNQIHF